MSTSAAIAVVVGLDLGKRGHHAVALDREGRWVLDETLTLCTGECDAYYADIESYYQQRSPLLPSPDATPVALAVATPRANSLSRRLQV